MSRKTDLTSSKLSKASYIYVVIDNNLFQHESFGLYPDWLFERRELDTKKIYIESKNSNILPHIGNIEIGL